MIQLQAEPTSFSKPCETNSLTYSNQNGRISLYLTGSCRMHSRDCGYPCLSQARHAFLLLILLSGERTQSQSDLNYVTRPPNLPVLPVPSLRSPRLLRLPLFFLCGSLLQRPPLFIFFTSPPPFDSTLFRKFLRKSPYFSLSLSLLHSYHIKHAFFFVLSTLSLPFPLPHSLSYSPPFPHLTSPYPQPISLSAFVRAKGGKGDVTLRERRM